MRNRDDSQSDPQHRDAGPRYRHAHRDEAEEQEIEGQRRLVDYYDVIKYTLPI